MNDSAWLLQVDEALRDVGYAVVPNVLDGAFIETTKTAMLLGCYSRPVTSLDEYYQPEEKRLYRKGQG
jgi:ectoine hydroxylase-related dioxygenase (phytanoyl-CoA dioxygenase family)